MGQYWAYANRTKGITYLQNSGIKMMEHSYTGNVNSNILYFLLANKEFKDDLKGITLHYPKSGILKSGAWIGDNLSHVGDYSDVKTSDGVPIYDLPAVKFSFKKDKETIVEEEFSTIMTNILAKKVYVSSEMTVDNTKDEYIDLTKMLFANAVVETKGVKENSWYKEGDWNTTVDSLTLLLSPLGDQSGGDYYDDYPNYLQQGRWFDMPIVMSKTQPEGVDITEQVFFTENYKDNPETEKEIKIKSDFIQNLSLAFAIYDKVKDSITDYESFKRQVIEAKRYFTPELDNLSTYLMKLKTEQSLEYVDTTKLFKRDMLSLTSI